MQTRKLLFAAAALVMLCLIPATAKADPITLFVDPTHTIAQGSSATYFGTLSNGGAPARFINGADITFFGPAGITFDLTAFFANVPPTLGAGSSTGLVAFFDVFVDALVAPGSYTASLSVLGGADGDDDNILATQEFIINVVPGGQTPVPEPMTLALLGTGLAGVAGAVRRRRQRRETDAP